MAWMVVADTLTILVGAVSVGIASKVAIVVVGPLFTSSSVYGGLSAVVSTAVMMDGGSNSGTIRNISSI